MEYPSTSTTELTTLPPSSTLGVKFLWKGLRTVISAKETPDQALYSINYGCMANKLTFTDGANTTFATGKLHVVNINPSCTLRGRNIPLQAQKRFNVQYDYLSPQASSTMTWTASCALSAWKFVCSDANSLPVARFKANTLSFTNMGIIEFMGDSANEALREEVVVTGMTVYYCMVMRSASILNLFGAVMHRNGSKKVKEIEMGDVVGGEEGDAAVLESVILAVSGIDVPVDASESRARKVF